MIKEKSRDDILIYNYDNDYVKDGSGIIQYLDTNMSITSKNMIFRAFCNLSLYDSLRQNMHKKCGTLFFAYHIKYLIQTYTVFSTILFKAKS